MGGGTLQANASFNSPVNIGLTGTGTTSTINTQGYNLTLSGNMTDSGGGNGLTKVGTGTLTLSGANTYTGATTVGGGTLALNYATTGAVLSSSDFTLQGGGTLQLVANNSVATTQNVSNLNVGTGGGFVVLNPNGGPGVTLNVTSRSCGQHDRRRFAVERPRHRSRRGGQRTGHHRHLRRTNRLL